MTSEDEVLAEFARGLRALRKTAGDPTYRALSAAAHYSVTSLAAAASGQKLPTLAVTTAYVRACSGNVEEWERRWRHAAAHLATADERATVASEQAPYRGLVAFDESDSKLFFGRERVVREVLDLIRDKRLVGLFGASGAGKTSVLRAGVAPACEEDVVVFSPGAQPLEEWAVHVAARCMESPVQIAEEFRADPANIAVRMRSITREGHDLLLIVDQFEEVFTLCANLAECAWFIRALVEVAHAPGSRCRVILGVRADFYGRCGEHGELVDALRDSQVLLGPMTPEELRRAIVKPAAVNGYQLEADLVTRLIVDTTGRAGVLPLLSHAVLETWHRRRGMTLTLAGYEAAGGIDHAVVRTAESAFDRLDEHHRRIAEDVFVRLVVLNDSGDDTKRRAGLEEWIDPAVLSVINLLARARLVTVDRDSVELAHEALIAHWPRLRGWLTEDRAALLAHRQVADAAHMWEDLGRDPAALYRGVLLSRAVGLLRTRRHLMSAKEQRFVAAAQSAARGRRYRIFGAVAIVVIVLLAATLYTVRTAQDNASGKQEAMVQRLVNDARSLRSTDLSLASQLALTAHHIQPGVMTRSAVLDLEAQHNADG
ncbi:nSTAND1 domain-containing NTPase [Actinokineospora diospyrosa]|uniref:Novel STAND NTPase 1 domain-containing protein n=1 Tax=Actinokineospora diospyrosa TaxID=103728 RepID=A0ABT1IJ33_9PSEU|nr:hypothetical protein [Actinokineospora diospyrosa]MCP2272664.1 hypothetical protein [Actinokineospora diospyrosa]